MIEVERRKEGAAFRIRVQPGAGRRGAGGERNGALVVRTTAAPERGKANADVVRILAEALGLKRSQIELVAGASARDKTILVREADARALETRLGALAAGG